MRPDFVARQQLDLLRERIESACNENGLEESARLFSVLSDIPGAHPKRLLIVGAGDSYPAAILAKQKLQRFMASPFIEAMTPHFAIRKLIPIQYHQVIYPSYSPIYDMVIAISYSGKSPDILQVYEHCKRANIPFTLITCAERYKMREIYPVGTANFFCFPHSSGIERGMISMAGTLIPTFPFLAHTVGFDKTTIGTYLYTLTEARDFVNRIDVSEIATNLRRAPVIHIFYDSYSEPTAADLDSKFTESGLATVVMHEKKNFSHGRYSVLYNQRFGLVINLIQKDEITNEVRYVHPYEELLEDFLKKICQRKSAFYLEIPITAVSGIDTFELNGHIDNFHGLAKVPYLVTAIGEELGVDISKPITPLYEKIPLHDEVDALYRYKGNF